MKKRIASSTPDVPSTVHVPDLSYEYDDVAWRNEHVSKGYIYVLRASLTAQDPLVFEDTDKYGVIDFYHLVSEDTWSDDFGDSSHYVP